MIENTLENKAKFFACYWGQCVLNWKGLNTVLDECYWIEGREEDEERILELTPLSAITDEDAIEMAKMESPFPEEIDELEIRDQRDEASYPYQGVFFDNEDGFPRFSFYFQNHHPSCKNQLDLSPRPLRIHTVDYLRSRSYALPWMGLSVEEQINYGWIRLKD